MALNPLNSSNVEQLALKGLTLITVTVSAVVKIMISQHARQRKHPLADFPTVLRDQ